VQQGQGLGARHSGIVHPIQVALPTSATGKSNQETYLGLGHHLRNTEQSDEHASSTNRNARKRQRELHQDHQARAADADMFSFINNRLLNSHTSAGSSTTNDSATATITTTSTTTTSSPLLSAAPRTTPTVSSASANARQQIKHLERAEALNQRLERLEQSYQRNKTRDKLEAQRIQREIQQTVDALSSIEQQQSKLLSSRRQQGERAKLLKKF
jgi:hypothetical protein